MDGHGVPGMRSSASALVRVPALVRLPMVIYGGAPRAAARMPHEEGE